MIILQNKKLMFNKHFAKNIAIFLLAFFAVSCSKEQKKIKLTIYEHNVFQDESFGKIVENYAQKEGFEVEDINIPQDYLYKGKLKDSFVSSKPPDIFMVDSRDDLRDFRFYIDKLDDLRDVDKINPIYLRDMNSKNGNIYALPVTSFFYSIFYNKTIFKKLKIDPNDIKNYDDLEAVLKKINLNKQNLKIKAPMISDLQDKKEFGKYQSDIFINDEITNSNYDGKIKFRNSEIFKKFVILQKKYSLSKKEQRNTFKKSKISNFLRGDVALIFANSLIYKSIEKEELAEKKEKSNKRLHTNILSLSKIGVLPMFENEKSKGNLFVASNHYFALNKKIPEEKKQLAKKFLSWIVSNQFQENIVRKGFLPVINLNSKKEFENSFYNVYYSYLKDDRIKSFSYKLYNVSWGTNALYFLLQEYLDGNLKWDHFLKISTRSWNNGPNYIVEK